MRKFPGKRKINVRSAYRYLAYRRCAREAYLKTERFFQKPKKADNDNGNDNENNNVNVDGNGNGNVNENKVKLLLRKSEVASQ